ncbi:MAG: nucleotidyltransferase family protein [Acidobacteria bacterium]|nr:nucleotidyltransferase family protein [Acidobacteriota bacterium]
MNRPEHRLLLECARICSEQERKDRILSSIAEGMDWEYLLAAAARHMMTSMIYRHLHAFCRDAVPSGIMAGLHEHYKKNSLNSLLYTAGLIKILDLFKRRGIRAIPFKGPVLAHSLYEEPELREFIDLDILVSEPDVFRALKLLSDLGYGTVPDFSPYIQAKILRNDFHYQVKKTDGGSMVELHWNLVPGYYGFKLPGSIWQQRAESASIQGHQVPNLTCEDQLTALSLHGYKHMWQSLIWIADIAKVLVRYPELNWDRVFNQSDHPDMRRILSLALILAEDLIDAPLPQEVRRRIRGDNENIRLAWKIQQALFRTASAEGTMGLKLLQFSLISGWGNRLRALVYFAFRPLPVDFNIVLPRFLYPLYFIMRPVGLLFRYLRRLTAGQ